jgi:hypothetical protein
LGAQLAFETQLCVFKRWLVLGFRDAFKAPKFGSGKLSLRHDPETCLMCWNLPQD